MATASTIDAMAKAVMASFGQEESKAVAWTSALAASLVMQQSQLADLLKADRAEKAAGRGGSSAWRVVVSALGQANIPEPAWPVLEAKLIQLLDGSFPAAVAAPSPLSSSGGSPPLQPLQLFNTMPLPWTVYKEAELGASKDKSGWRAFSNAEHVNLWRFNKQWGETQRQARCDEVSKRGNIYKAPGRR